jgi:hypothetical protein
MGSTLDQSSGRDRDAERALKVPNGPPAGTAPLRAPLQGDELATAHVSDSTLAPDK